MKKRILVIDPTASGISGDMLVGALVNLGANKQKLKKAMMATRKYLVGCSKLNVKFVNVRRGSFACTRLIVYAEEAGHEKSALELTNAQRKTLAKISLSKRAKLFAENSLSTLIQAEGHLHESLEGEINLTKIHLHEAGSIDTLVDIIGSAAALDDLGLFSEGTKIVCTPIAIGGGAFTFSHGRVSNPAPASLEIARKYKLNIVGGPIAEELATPTGLSLIANLADPVLYYPRLKPIRVGLGAGQKEFPGIPNILRVVLGEANSKIKRA